MNDAYLAVLRSTGWLYTVVYRNGLFYWDLWAFIHLWCGMVLMAGLMRARVRRPVAWLFAVVIGYELLELALLVASVRVFEPEVLVDKLWDVIVGCAGGAMAWWGVPTLRRAASGPNGDLAGAGAAGFFAALSISFDWVALHGVRDGGASLEPPGFDWWAWAFWTCGLTATVLVDALLKRVVPHPGGRLPVVMALYAAGLLAAGYAARAIPTLGSARGDAHSLSLFGPLRKSGALAVFCCLAGLGVIVAQDLVARLIELRRWTPAPAGAARRSR